VATSSDLARILRQGASFVTWSRFLISDLHPPITNLEHRSAFKNEFLVMLQKDLSRSAIGDYKSLMRTHSAALNGAF